MSKGRSQTRGPPSEQEGKHERKRRLDSLEAAQGAPRDPRRASRGERSPLLPLEAKPDSPVVRGGTPRLAPPLAHAPPLHFLTSRALQAPLALALFHPGTSLFSKATKENLEEEVRCQLCIFCLAASNGHSSAPVVTWSHH